MFLTLLGRVIVIRFEQFLNVSSEMVFKLEVEGKMTDSREVQSLKALLPMSLTLLGRVIVVRLGQR